MKYKELTQNISGSLRTLSQDSPDLMKSRSLRSLSHNNATTSSGFLSFKSIILCLIFSYGY